jgi:glycogen(starch) synthase
MAPDHLIEVSFEVSNKVGGIYQVLKSKAGKMKDYYGDDYIAIGFYDEENARDDFIRRDDMEMDFFDELEEKGIKCHGGVWDIPGSPKCILVDADEYQKPVDDIKEMLWEEYSVDSIEAGSDFDEPVKWSHAVGEVVKKLEDKLNGDKVVHVHEWLSGPAMLEVESPTVFTTHATVLGRALSNSDYDLRSAVKAGNVEDTRASEHGVTAKHQMEKTAAREADVFTTVSKTTGKEAEAVLDVRPDKILPNGFNVEEFPSLEELSYQHKKKKDHMKEFLRAYFEPYYDVNLEDDPRILFTSGRYEFHNKGIDIFIDALSKLNEKKGEEFFVFIFVPSDVKGAKQEVLENISLYEELEDYVESTMPEMRRNILNSITSGTDPREGAAEALEDGSTLESLQRNFHSKQNQSPPLCAFDLNYAHDSIIERLRERGLKNREDDRVKIVFYPTYLSVGDRMLSMDYKDAMVACSGGIFPSYYEPWGYTPVETAANGTLSVTTDLAGFGQFLLENTEEEERKGIQVLGRENLSDRKAASDLADIIEDMVSYSKTEITERKHNARKLAQMTSWEKLGENYLEAHERAQSES